MNSYSLYILNVLQHFLLLAEKEPPVHETYLRQLMETCTRKSIDINPLTNVILFCLISNIICNFDLLNDAL